MIVLFELLGCWSQGLGACACTGTCSQAQYCGNGIVVMLIHDCSKTVCKVAAIVAFCQLQALHVDLKVARCVIGQCSLFPGSSLEPPNIGTS